MTLKILAIAAAAVGSGVFLVTGQTTAQPAIYTAAQAAAGRAAYEETCGKCHTPGLSGRKGDPGELPALDTLPADWQKVVRDVGGRVPPLAGEKFLAIWGPRSTKDLTQRIKEATLGGFPPQGANEQTVFDIAAYVLQANGARAGSQALTADTAIPVQSLVAAPASAAR
jgi:mono/diheme cytochrome c family protein